jgi:hypothetical protein
VLGVESEAFLSIRRGSVWDLALFEVRSYAPIKERGLTMKCLSRQYTESGGCCALEQANALELRWSGGSRQLIEEDGVDDQPIARIVMFYVSR